ncbi:MAG: mechanosensitive ion channel family protein [Clostridia bacterium]
MLKILESINLIQLAIALAIVIVFYLVSPALTFIIVKLFNLKLKDRNKITKIGIYRPLKSFIKLLGIYIAIAYMKFPGNIMDNVNVAFRICIIFLFALGLANSVNPNSTLFKNMQKKLRQGEDNTITVFISKTLKVIIYLFAGVIMISELGYDINGLIAGLGLGGLTVALAAQDAAKNLFGGVVIILDKPFKQGDWIKTSTLEGTVEEINFRSTRIRTFDDSVIVIPNSTLSNDSIVNWSQMNKRKVFDEIKIDYCVSAKNLSTCITKIDKMLREHKGVHNDVINVYFEQIADSGFNILIHYFTTATDYSSYLQTKEDVNYKILNILAAENVTIAYPSSSVYLKK